MHGKRCCYARAACKLCAGLQVQGERSHFYVTATAKPASKVISLEALEKRRMEIDKYLVQSTTNRPHRLSLSQTPSIAGDSQMDDTSVVPTPRDGSPSPTPRTLSLSNPHNTGQDSPNMSEKSNPDLAYQRSPRSGKPRGGFAFSDRPLLGGEAEDLARSKSFTGQELRQRPSNLSIATGRDIDEDSTQAMRRLAAPLHHCHPSLLSRLQVFTHSNLLGCILAPMTTCTSVPCPHSHVILLKCCCSHNFLWHSFSVWVWAACHLVSCAQGRCRG